jgi:hypothetical protein
MSNTENRDYDRRRKWLAGMSMGVYDSYRNCQPDRSLLFNNTKIIYQKRSAKSLRFLLLVKVGEGHSV